MEKEKYERAIAINNRLKELEFVKKEISPTTKFRLNYVDKDNKGCAEWRMNVIGDLFDKHDVMIRAEIQQEIDALNSEIETL